MFVRLSVFVIALLLNSEVVAQQKFRPAGHTELMIGVDGRPAFRGKMFEGSDVDRVNLATLLVNARFRLLMDEIAYARRVGVQLPFKGSIQLQIDGCQVIQLESVRLSYTPIYGPAPKEWEWRIHPDDQAIILSRWQTIQDQKSAEAWKDLWRESTPLIPSVVVLVALFILLTVIVKNRIARQVQSRSVVASPEARWWDE